MLTFKNNITLYILQMRHLHSEEFIDESNINMSWVENVILHLTGFVLNPEHNLKQNLRTFQYLHTQIVHVSIHPLRFKSC